MHSFGAADRVVVLPSARHYRAYAYKISYVYARKILKYRFIDHFTVPLCATKSTLCDEFSSHFHALFSASPSAILNFAVRRRGSLFRASFSPYCPLYLYDKFNRSAMPVPTKI